MKKANWKLFLLGAAVVSIAVSGCAKQEKIAETPAPDAESVAEAAPETVARAQAELEQGSEREPAGMVMFTQDGDQVKIVAHLVGVPPGTHGLHIHELGDCSADDFTSAGGHFNPTDAPHGGPDDDERHAGDLGNIVIGSDGSGHLELTSDMLSVDEGVNGVIGRGVILHAKEDDLVSQPTGAAGARLACGVVVSSEDV